MTIVVTVSATSGTVLNGARVDPGNVIAELNEDADDPDRVCADVGEGTDVAPATEPDNFDCTGHTVTVQPDLTITKASVPVDGSNVSTGATITYTLTASNAAAATATASNVVIRDTVGSGLTFVSATPGSGVTCGAYDPVTRQINCTAASIAPGENRTVPIAVTVSATSGTVLNGARVDPANAIAESNEDADDPDRVCADVGEGTDVAPATEPDNFDCTAHTVTGQAVVSIGTASGAPGTDVSVPLEVRNVPSPGVAAVKVDIVYDASKVTPSTYSGGAGWDLVQCNLTYGANTIRCDALKATGMTGDALVANITFHIKSDASGCSGLDVQIVKFVDKDNNDIPVTDEDGQICAGVCGDVNGDNEVDVVDALFVLQHDLGQRQCSSVSPPPPGTLSCALADVNCDLEADIVDALFILQHDLGLRPNLCVCAGP